VKHDTQNTNVANSSNALLLKSLCK
jgi:hypothetical protein